MKLYMFRTVPLSIICSLFTVHSAVVYVIQVCRQLSSRPVRNIQFLKSRKAISRGFCKPDSSEQMTSRSKCHCRLSPVSVWYEFSFRAGLLHIWWVGVGLCLCRHGGGLRARLTAPGVHWLREGNDERGADFTHWLQWISVEFVTI